MDSHRRLKAALLFGALAIVAVAQPVFAQAQGKADLADPAMAVEKIDLEPKSAPPETGSVRARAFAALATATDVTLHSLQPWQFPIPPKRWKDLPSKERDRREQALLDRSQDRWCKREKCFHDNRELGRTRVAAADWPVVRTALSQALGQVPPYASMCAPEYRHAVSFLSGGQRYDILLCYQCGQLLVFEGDRRDGGQAERMGDQRALNAILQRAGIALAEAPDYEDDEAAE